MVQLGLADQAGRVVNVQPGFQELDGPWRSVVGHRWGGARVGSRSSRLTIPIMNTAHVAQNAATGTANRTVANATQPAPIRRVELNSISPAVDRSWEGAETRTQTAQTT